MFAMAFSDILACLEIGQIVGQILKTDISLVDKQIGRCLFGRNTGTIIDKCGLSARGMNNIDIRDQYNDVALVAAELLTPGACKVHWADESRLVIARRIFAVSKAEKRK
jgi:hypothetical protein